MPEYLRWREPRGTYFFTIVTYLRRPILRDPAAVALLRRAFAEVRGRHAFEINAIVVLPDHLHAVWTLPPGDANFSTRWRLIKRSFTEAFLKAGGREGPRSASRVQQDERGVWQRRFWEHLIRDEHDLEQYVDYIHYNPVKHGHATCPHAWPYSSFARWVERGVYRRDWACACPRAAALPNLRPTITVTPEEAGE